MFSSLVRMEFTWTTERPYLLCVVMKQIMAICWAIAYVRQLESVLKKNWLLPLTEHMSIHDLIDRVPKDRLLRNGASINMVEIGAHLLKYGVLLESECPLAVLFKEALHHFDYTIFGCLQYCDYRQTNTNNVDKQS